MRFDPVPLATTTPHTNMTTNGIPVVLSSAHAEAFLKFELKGTICCLQECENAPKEALVRLEFLNKGAANVVFTIHRPEASITGACFFFVHIKDEDHRISATAIPYETIAREVLRIPRGKEKHLTADDILYGHEQIRPLFLPGTGKDQRRILSIDDGLNPVGTKAWLRLDQDFSEHLMHLERVALFPGVITHLSSLTDSSTFDMDRITSERFLRRTNLAILLPDMSSVPKISFTIEIKPKWLLQSPNAPTDAVRCRTCAMQLVTSKPRDGYICPLRLVNGGIADLRLWVRKLVAHHFGGSTNVLSNPRTEQEVSSIIDRLTRYLVLGNGRALLQHLLLLQSKLDPIGILRREEMGSPTFDNNMRLAMTLRDCSWFIVIPYAEESAITSKLADLDFKSEEKLDDWKEKEERLLRDGMYTQETTSAPKCWLSRQDNFHETEGKGKEAI